MMELNDKNSIQEDLCYEKSHLNHMRSFYNQENISKEMRQYFNSEMTLSKARIFEYEFKLACLDFREKFYKEFMEKWDTYS